MPGEICSVVRLSLRSGGPRGSSLSVCGVAAAGAASTRARSTQSRTPRMFMALPQYVCADSCLRPPYGAVMRPSIRCSIGLNCRTQSLLRHQDPPAPLSLAAGRRSVGGHPRGRRAADGALAKHLIEPVWEVREHAVYPEGDQGPHLPLLVDRVRVDIQATSVRRGYQRLIHVGLGWADTYSVG